MALRFSFRETPLTIKAAKDADPQAIGLALHAIAVENNGRLTWREALPAARNRRSPLHRHIEWNDKIAAEKHRREQINELIRLVIRDDPDDEQIKPQRAFLSIRDVDGTSYRTVDEVLRSADLQLKVLQQARRDLLAWQSRYSDLQEVCELVRVAEEQLQKKIKAEEGRRSRRVV